MPEVPTWPALLERYSGVAHLGGPRRVGAAVLVAFFVLVIVYVGIWNAFRYPVMLGYDAQPNVAYSHVLLDHHRLPTAAESGESAQPPGYYAVAGLAARLGAAVGWNDAAGSGTGESSLRGAQLLNVVFVLATGILLIALMGLVLPSADGAAAAALGFFAFTPVVAKTEAMFHAEPMNMFLSTLALYLAVSAMRGDRLSKRRVVAAFAVLAFGLISRPSIVFTAIAITIGLAVRFARRHGREHLRVSLTAFAVGGVLLVGTLGVFVVRGHSLGALGNLAHPTAQTSVPGREHFLDLPTARLFTAPYRPNFVNQAIATTYTEIWGDWVGAFAWSSYSGAPWGPTMKVLQDQAWIGVLPTILAIFGFGLLVMRVTKNDALLMIALTVPLAVAGYAIRSYQLMSADGDLLKASYVLDTAPLWAICFGCSFQFLGRYPRLRAALSVGFLIFGILELRFMLYGLRDHSPIF